MKVKKSAKILNISILIIFYLEKRKRDKNGR